MTGLDEPWMRAAIAIAQQGIAAGQSPFGCAIVDAAAQTLLVAAHNQVWSAGDPPPTLKSPPSAPPPRPAAASPSTAARCIRPANPAPCAWPPSIGPADRKSVV